MKRSDVNMKRKIFCLIISIMLVFSLNAYAFAGAESVYQGKAAVSADSNNYEAYSMQDGKYISLVRSINTNYAESYYSTAWLLNSEGKVLYSGGRYAYFTHFAKDKVIGYGPEKIASRSAYINEPEYSYKGAYLIDLKEKKKTKLDIPDFSFVYECAGNGIARVSSPAASDAGSYRFINKSGKTVISEKEYRFCSDFYKVGKSYYYYTIDKSGKNLTKRDSKGKAVKSVKIGIGDNQYRSYGARVYNINGKKIIRIQNGKAYDLNLKATTYDETDFFNNAGNTYSHKKGDYHRQSDGLTEITYSYKPSLEIGWKKLHPVVEPNLVVSMDACDYNNWNIVEGRWTWLSNNRNENQILSDNMFSHGESYFQDFAFEKSGKKYRMWSLAGAAQYTSCENGPLALGKRTNKDIQLFTIIDNGDGTISIKDYKGRYLTCEGTSVESRTTFLPYTGADNQKYTIEDHESLTIEMGMSNW